MDKTMVLKPRLSEKTYGQSQALNVYVFVVPTSANKINVAKAVEAQFDVTVEGVNVASVKGKVKRTFLNNRGKFTRGQRSNLKKAYVTLQEGYSIPIFTAEEEAEKKAEKAAEKAEKKAKKERK